MDIEQFAIRAAKGNNGGEWATHYTEEQKEFWRQFVRELFAAEREWLEADAKHMRNDIELRGQEIERLGREIERYAELLRGVGANRYWEGRWRDEKAENERLRAALQEIEFHGGPATAIARHALEPKP